MEGGELEIVNRLVVKISFLKGIGVFLFLNIFLVVY